MCETNFDVNQKCKIGLNYQEIIHGAAVWSGSAILVTQNC